MSKRNTCGSCGRDRCELGVPDTLPIPLCLDCQTRYKLFLKFVNWTCIGIVSTHGDDPIAPDLMVLKHPDGRVGVLHIDMGYEAGDEELRMDEFESLEGAMADIAGKGDQYVGYFGHGMLLVSDQHGDVGLHVLPGQYDSPHVLER